MVKMTGNPKGFDVSLDPVKRIQKYIDSYRNDTAYKGFEALMMRTIRIISAEAAPSTGPSSADDPWQARAVFELEVIPEMCNPMENMHGGAVALIADMATTMAAAPASEKGFWEFGGVSRTLNVTYLAPMPKGSTVEIDCKLVSAGGRLSLIRCAFKDRDSKSLLALAEHMKVAAGTQVKPSWRKKERL